jgi:hypothetical protein
VGDPTVDVRSTGAGAGAARLPGMRILFTAQPAGGHVRPLVPVAHAALRRGHDVAFLAPPRMADELASYGLRHVVGGYDFAAEIGARIPRGYRNLSYAEAAAVNAGFAPWLTEVWAGRMGVATARDVLELATTWRPDLVVREADEFGGYLAAEVLGIPQVTVLSFGGLDLILPERLAPVLDASRAELGLPPDPDGARLYAPLTVNFLPESYGRSEMLLPHTRCYRHESSARLDDRLPAWTAAIETDRSTVFVGFGTVVYDLPGADAALATVVAAAARLDATVIVAAPPRLWPDALPDNVRLVPFLAQPLLLEQCDLFVTHGGLNSLKEAIRLGVPMVSVAVAPDHRHNADTCAALGICRTVDLVDLSADTLAAACTDVLADPKYRRRARALQRALHVLPPVDQLVTDMTALVTGATR